MKSFTISPDVSTGECPQSVADVQELADSEFQSVLNLRSFEEGEQDEFSSRDEGVAVREAGLAYLSYPLDADDLDGYHVSSFRTKLSMLPAPTYVHAGSSPEKPAALSLIDHALQKDWSAKQALQCAGELELPCREGRWPAIVEHVLNSA